MSGTKIFMLKKKSGGGGGGWGYGSEQEQAPLIYLPIPKNNLMRSIMVAMNNIANCNRMNHFWKSTFNGLHRACIPMLNRLVSKLKKFSGSTTSNN